MIIILSIKLLNCNYDNIFGFFVVFQTWWWWWRPVADGGKVEIKDYWVVDGEAHQHSNEVVLSEDNDDDHKKWGLWWGLMMIIMMPMMSPTWWIGPSDHDNNDCEVVGDDDDCLVSSLEIPGPPTKIRCG